SSLPPLHLDILDVVARFRPVHIFLLQPSDLYWADLKSSKQIARTSQRIAIETPQLDLDLEEMSFDIGNPLLPSFGKQGQAFLDLILDKDPIHDDAAFQEPKRNTQLNCLQSYLFALESRSPSESPSRSASRRGG
ncbi:MAG: exodeoxyribonuclease V subunit gamma, partial [Proteobacteria bacterium]|nr:exodeoxyribonuclease V subunit gamma [Pseudomonadota bacterium]